MSDEEKNLPNTPDEPTGVVHWNGPKKGKWPEVLKAPEEPTGVIPSGSGKFRSISGDGGTPAGPPPETDKTDPVPAGPPPLPEPSTPEEERNYRPIRFRRDGRIGCLGGLMYATFIICVSVVVACYGWMAASDVLALNKPSTTVEITLPDSAFYDKEVEVTDDDGNVIGMETVRAADIRAVAGLLKDYGLINYEWLFRLYSSFSNADLQIDPGTYELDTSLDYRALVKKMQIGSGSQLQTLVMFPEGYTMDQIFTKLEENRVCSKDDLYEAAASAEFSYAFLEGVGTGDAQRLEGFLFPDTYYFFEGMQASSAINKFLSNLHYKVTAEMWQRADEMSMTFKEVMTVASLIEREAANDDERSLIASVIYNRLSQGMPLQIDATVLYAYSLQGETLEALSTESIQAMDSPYNTYLYTGLPPGPICNPGLNSIQAALNPADSGYLFYALDTETSTHRFFLYQDEHEAFVATQDYGGGTE